MFRADDNRISWTRPPNETPREGHRWDEMTERRIYSEAAMGKCDHYACGSCFCLVERINRCPHCGKTISGLSAAVYQYNQYNRCECGTKILICNGYVRGYVVFVDETSEDDII